MVAIEVVKEVVEEEKKKRKKKRREEGIKKDEASETLKGNIKPKYK